MSVNFHANISTQFLIHIHFILLLIQNHTEKKREIIKQTFLQIGFPLLLIFWELYGYGITVYI